MIARRAADGDGALTGGRAEARDLAVSGGLSPDYLALIDGGSSLLVHPPGTVLATPSAATYQERRTIAVPDEGRDGRWSAGPPPGRHTGVRRPVSDRG